MADIQTAQERDMIAAFLASKGVTECPPRYVEHVNGGAAFSFVGRAVKTKRHRFNARNDGKTGESKVEVQKAARDEARAIIQARNARNEGRSRLSGMAVMQERRKRESSARRIRVLRIINDQWTVENIALAAHREGISTKAMRDWLRVNGFAEKLPPPIRTGINGHSPEKTKAAHEEVVRAYLDDETATIESVAKARGYSVRQTTRILKAANVTIRMLGSTPRPINDLDRKISAFYAAGYGLPDGMKYFRVSKDRVLTALKKCGVKTRPNGSRPTRRLKDGAPDFSEAAE